MMFTLLLAFTALAEDTCTSDVYDLDAPCLLTLKANRNTVKTATAVDANAEMVDVHAAMQKHVSWAESHAKIRQALKAMPTIGSAIISSDPTDVNAFIRSQQASADSCHAKILEVRRTLDGILKKVNVLSDEVEGHEAIISGNTGVIEENVDNRHSGDNLLQDTYTSCEKEFNLAMADLQHYRLEITELEQIANPAVRSKIHFNADMEEETEYHAQQVHSAALRHAIREAHTMAAASAIAEAGVEAKLAAEAAEKGETVEEPTSLLAKSSIVGKVDLMQLSNEQCVKLAKVLLTELKVNGTAHPEIDPDDKKPRPHADDAETMLACNGTRAKLQETFELSWNGLNELLNDGEKLAEDSREECRLAAKNANEERQDNYDNQIKDATINIQAARNALQQLNSLLDNANHEVTLLDMHLNNMKSICTIETGVSEHLVAVRNLIHSLENCPGRSNFRLIIPQSETTRIGIGSNENSWSNTIGVEGSQVAKAAAAEAEATAATEE